VRTHTRKLGEIAPGVLPQGAKTCFFSVFNATRPFGHLSCTDFDYFWNKRRESVSACVHWWKISEFLRRGFFTSPKQLKWVLLRWGVFALGTAHTAQFWAMGIISGTSRHPKDVPCVREFWWGTYGVGAISPQKKFGNRHAVDYTACWRPAPRHNYFCRCSLGGTAVAIAHSLFLFKIAVRNSA